MQVLAKLQTDKEASIRTNTTYCLAQISSHLSAETRQKVLASAFLRALRDPFGPSRVAGLAALNACLSYISQDDCAKRVVPSIAPFAVDPIREVRESCLKTLINAVQRLQTMSEQMQTPTSSGPLDHGATNGAGGVGSTEAKSAHAATQAAAAAAEVLGKVGSWAVSSLASKLYGGATDDKKSNTSFSSSSSAGPSITDAHSKNHASSVSKPNGSVPAKAQAVDKRATSSPSDFKTIEASNASTDWNDDFFGDFDDGATSTSMSLSTKKQSKPAAASTAPAPVNATRATSRKTGDTASTAVAAKPSSGKVDGMASFLDDDTGSRKPAQAGLSGFGDWDSWTSESKPDHTAGESSLDAEMSAALGSFSSAGKPNSRQSSGTMSKKAPSSAVPAAKPVQHLTADWDTDDMFSSPSASTGTKAVSKPAVQTGHAAATDDWDSLVISAPAAKSTVGLAKAASVTTSTSAQSGVPKATAAKSGAPMSLKTAPSLATAKSKSQSDDWESFLNG